MAPHVLLVVLFSALLHAGWNALVRSGADKFLSTLLVVVGAGVASLLLLPWLPVPHPSSWPFILASGLIHVLYFQLLALSYRNASLGVAYPVMRGLAPVLTALLCVLLLGERLAALAWSGVGLICGGILLLALATLRQRQARGAALGFAVANACVIAGYTVVDGQGARASAHALSYTAWVFVLTAVFMLALTLARRIPLPLKTSHLRVAAWGGLGSLASYSLVLWAMTQAPIALVAALREMSIVFAALIGVLFLKESPGRLQGVCVVLVCLGVMCLRLA